MKSRSFHLFALFALLFSLAGNLLTFTTAYAASFTVNTLNDTTDTNAGNGICADFSGDCSLRAAIQEANALAGADTITFAADYTITLAGSQLPEVTSAITINGKGETNTIIQANANPNTANYRIFYISSGGNLTLDGLTIRNGRCIDACATLVNPGGGVYNAGTLTITNSTFSGNSANVGGGVYNQGTLTIMNSTFSGNSATGSGGGVYHNLGALTITNSTFTGNSAISGGGVNNQDTLAITNSTFTGNSATNIGGGIYNDFSALTITNSTFTGNSATNLGGGIYNDFGALHLVNTIFANSVSGGDCFSSFTFSGSTAKNNLIESTGIYACNLTDSVNGNIIGSDPKLGPLADNDGKTQTHALLAGSPAIDAGANCATTDQRSIPRPQGSACDIGAYEYGAVIPVVSASNPAANATLTSLSYITVVFNQDMLDNASTNGAENVNNYILVERGANGTFDTLSCNGGLVADDVPKAISIASYNSAGFVTLLTLASPLAAGTYRIFVCGTTSIFSAAGIKLNNGLSDSAVDFTVSPTASIATVTAVTTVATTASALPKTGFAPNKTTTLRPQPALYEYASLGELQLEIPSLNVKSTIVGVPQNTDKSWDVTWLGSDVGWLNGTAFPTWNGNSVLTAHVTNASGMNGPFAALRSLKYGERIIVHMDGLQYIYEVRNSRLARPYSTSYAFQSIQDHAYLTLITCQGYNPITESYLFRRVVRAVLISVENE